MEVVHERCAGLDVHQQTVVACARVVVGRKIEQDVKTFDTTTQGLLALCDWLTTLGLVRAGESGTIGRYLGYMAPYATSHDDLDRDAALQEEVRNAARSLVETVRQLRSGRLRQPDAALTAPREK